MTTLPRLLRRRDLTGILLHAMVGAGMLAAPARVYGLAHDWSLVVLGVAGLILLPLIACFADLGGRFSATGGPILYAREALGPWAGFLAGWLMWISQGLGIATLSNLLITYLGGFAPWIEAGPARSAFLLVLGAATTLLVVSGVRRTASASNLLIVVKLAFVLGFLALGVAFIRPERLMPASSAPALIPFAQAVLIYLFAASGFERGTVIAGEARDPVRDVPMSLVMGLGIALAAYGAVLAVCVGVLDRPDATDRPLAEAGRLILGAPGQAFATIGACIVILGTIISLLFAMPRLLVGLVEQGQLPALLGRVSARWRTPHWAILSSAIFGFGAAGSGDLIGVLTFSTAARLSVYIVSCVALWRLAGREAAPRPALALPAPRFIAMATVVIYLGVLAFGAQKELPMLAGVTAFGLGLYALTARRRAPAPDPRNTP